MHTPEGGNQVTQQNTKHSDVMSGDETFSILMTVNPQHCPFKPCIAQTLWLLIQVSVPFFFFFLHSSAGMHVQNRCTWCYYFWPTDLWETRPGSLRTEDPTLTWSTSTSFSKTNVKCRLYWKKSFTGRMQQQNLTLCQSSATPYPLLAGNLNIYQS